MFCDDVWARNAHLVRAIHDHPFNAELAKGTLDRERFGFYMVQDARYLMAYAKALATVSVRADDPEEGAFWALSAHTALVAERELHGVYLRDHGIRAADIRTSPTCLAYSSYLQATALTASYGVAVAAVLPCFWIYQDIGDALLPQVTPDHPYYDWISTYADPAFTESVAQARTIADRAATPAVETQMIEAFTQATEYEWMFWDSAYNLESWPRIHP